MMLSSCAVYRRKTVVMFGLDVAFSHILNVDCKLSLLSYTVRDCCILVLCLCFLGSKTIHEGKTTIICFVVGLRW